MQLVVAATTHSSTGGGHGSVERGENLTRSVLRNDYICMFNHRTSPEHGRNPGPDEWRRGRDCGVETVRLLVLG